MRRVLHLVIGAALAAGLVGVATAPAGAQTGDLAAFCAARIEGNDAQGKAANLAVMNKLVGVAPAAAVSQITAIRDGYQKQGDKLFDTPKGLQLLATLDGWVYDNCPGTKVPVTAIDYQYQGVPATIKAGVANFKLTNAAPKEDHMMAVFKLKPAAAGRDVGDLLALGQKKQDQYFDESGGAFRFAPAGQVGYSPASLTPGTYMYACFLPVGGKKNGAPHFTEGMYGTFTVS